MSNNNQLSLKEIEAFKKLQYSLIKHFNDHNSHDHPYLLKAASQCKKFIESVSCELKNQLQLLSKYLEENRFEYVHNFLQIFIILLEKPICPYAFSIIDNGNVVIVGKYLSTFFPLLRYNNYEYIINDLEKVIYHIIRSIPDYDNIEMIILNFLNLIIQLSDSLLQIKINDHFVLFTSKINNIEPIYLEHLSNDNQISFLQSILSISVDIIETNNRLLYSQQIKKVIIDFIKLKSRNLIILYSSLVDSVCSLYNLILNSPLFNNSFYYYILESCIKLITYNISKRSFYFTTKNISKCLNYFYNNPITNQNKMIFTPKYLSFSELLYITNEDLFISFLNLYLSTYYKIIETLDRKTVENLIKEYKKISSDEKIENYNKMVLIYYY